MFTWCTLKSGAGSHDAVTLHNTKGQSATFACIPILMHMRLDQSHAKGKTCIKLFMHPGDGMPSPSLPSASGPHYVNQHCMHTVRGSFEVVVFDIELYEQAWK